MSYSGHRPRGPEARGRGGGSAGSGHEQKESGLLRAAGRARLPQPLQAAGRVSGGAHGGNQGNGPRPALGQRGPPQVRAAAGPLPAGLCWGPASLLPLPAGGRGQLRFHEASRSAAPSLRPKTEAGERPRRRRWGSSASRLCPCGGAVVTRLKLTGAAAVTWFCFCAGD